MWQHTVHRLSNYNKLPVKVNKLSVKVNKLPVKVNKLVTCQTEQVICQMSSYLLILNDIGSNFGDANLLHLGRPHSTL